MLLNVRALAGVGAILGGLTLLGIGLLNVVWPGYGVAVLSLAASIYPGYDGPGGIGSVLVAALYAALDGAVTGALIAWLYNVLVGSSRAHGERFTA